MKIFSKEFIKQFISYFCIGGISAIVEWILFYLFSSVFNVNYLIAAAMAFVFSTTTNWFLGKTITFSKSKKYQNTAEKEFGLIFLVSGIGLMLNLVLMYIFVAVVKLNTESLMTFSKIMATGIVFVWNFLIRRLLIYKDICN